MPCRPPCGPIPPARLVTTLVWPPALVAFLSLVIGRVGFNPTDEGMVLAYAARMLQGQVPHRDFITPRPVGASVLHLIEFVLPGPMLMKSHVIALGEMTAIAILFGVVVFRATPVRWSALQTALVLAALVIDLHTFPLMAWSPVDGVLLTLVGVVLIRPVSGDPPGRLRRWSGLFIAGAAVTTKQSFILVPVLAAVLASWPAPQRGGTAFLRRLLMNGAISAAPGALYAGVLSALGAGPAMVTQLLSQRDVDLFAVFKPLRADALLLVIGAAASVGLALPLLRQHRPDWVRGVRTGTAVAMLLLTVLILALGRLALAGAWGGELVQLLLAYIAISWVASGRLDVDAAIVAALAWMVTLSLGYQNPDLCAGGVALVLFWRGATLLGPVPAHVGRTRGLAWSVAAAAIITLSLGSSIAARTTDVYREAPAAELTASVSAAIPAFSGISLDPTTQRYLVDVTRCIRQHPSRSVAVLPDNQALYPALGIHNPLPIDWMIPPDYQGSEQRIVDAAGSLGARGHYLVLFETFDAVQLSSIGLSGYERHAALAAAHPDAPLPYAPGVLQQVRDRLHGDAFGCGAFIGVYAP